MVEISGISFGMTFELLLALMMTEAPVMLVNGLQIHG